MSLDELFSQEDFVAIQTGIQEFHYRTVLNDG